MKKTKQKEKAHLSSLVWSMGMADSEANRVAEETFPDMLKNTPSNIRRLEDEIEQCKGHQKYLAQTRSPSDGSDVRWYFCKVPLAVNGNWIPTNIEIPSFSVCFYFSIDNLLLP